MSSPTEVHRVNLQKIIDRISTDHDEIVKSLKPYQNALDISKKLTPEIKSLYDSIFPSASLHAQIFLKFLPLIKSSRYLQLTKDEHKSFTKRALSILFPTKKLSKFRPQRYQPPPLSLLLAKMGVDPISADEGADEGAEGADEGAEGAAEGADEGAEGADEGAEGAAEGADEGAEGADEGAEGADEGAAKDEDEGAAKDKDEDEDKDVNKEWLDEWANNNENEGPYRTGIDLSLNIDKKQYNSLQSQVDNSIWEEVIDIIHKHCINFDLIDIDKCWEFINSDYQSDRTKNHLQISPQELIIYEWINLLVSHGIKDFYIALTKWSPFKENPDLIFGQLNKLADDYQKEDKEQEKGDIKLSILLKIYQEYNKHGYVWHYFGFLKHDDPGLLLRAKDMEVTPGLIEIGKKYLPAPIYDICRKKIDGTLEKTEPALLTKAESKMVNMGVLSYRTTGEIYNLVYNDRADVYCNSRSGYVSSSLGWRKDKLVSAIRKSGLILTKDKVPKEFRKNHVKCYIRINNMYRPVPGICYSWPGYMRTNYLFTLLHMLIGTGNVDIIEAYQKGLLTAAEIKHEAIKAGFITDKKESESEAKEEIKVGKQEVDETKDDADKEIAEQYIAYLQQKRAFAKEVATSASEISSELILQPGSVFTVSSNNPMQMRDMPTFKPLEKKIIVPTTREELVQLAKELDIPVPDNMTDDELKELAARCEKHLDILKNTKKHN